MLQKHTHHNVSTFINLNVSKDELTNPVQF